MTGGPSLDGSAATQRRRRAKGTVGAAWKAALLVGGLLALASPWRPGGSSDGIAVFRTAASLAFEGTFILPKAPPGARFDSFYFPPSPDGSGVVSVYAPFGALLGAALLLGASAVPSPPFAGGLADGLASVAPIVATALAVFPLARLLRLGGAGRRPAPWLAAALVLGTFLGPLGVSDFQEPWLVLFGSFALERALVSRLLRGRTRHSVLAAAGAALSLALLAKPTAVVLAPALALPSLMPRYGERRAAGLVSLVTGAIPGIALLATLNEVRFGSPLALGYESQLAHPLARAVSPAWTVLRLTLFPNRGLLWYAPLLLLAPVVLPRLLRERRRHAVLLASLLGFGGFFAANVSWFAWDGGFGWGPRLLAPAVACAAPLLAVRAHHFRLAIALAALGAFVNLPGYLLDPGRVYRVAASAPEGDPVGPVVPIHRRDAGRGALEPLQRPHYVLTLAAPVLAPSLVARLFVEGDGPDAGATGSGRTHDAAILRSFLREPPGEGSETGRLLLGEAWVTAGSDPERARRMADRAARLGAEQTQ